MSKVTGEITCYTINYTIVVDDTKRNGSDRVVSEAAQPALLAWVPTSSHLASSRVKGATAKPAVKTVFSTTFDAGEEA